MDGSMETVEKVYTMGGSTTMDVVMLCTFVAISQYDITQRDIEDPM